MRIFFYFGSNVEYNRLSWGILGPRDLPRCHHEFSRISWEFELSVLGLMGLPRYHKEFNRILWDIYVEADVNEMRWT